ncbi:hypothetical protein MPSEU_001006700 [Mayamaea pseudoterrestris]|nr:hypothetical protein MPSEU_001006700 [Mayamaea pseudoterrestris]
MGKKEDYWMPLARQWYLESEGVRDEEKMTAAQFLESKKFDPNEINKAKRSLLYYHQMYAQDKVKYDKLYGNVAGATATRRTKPQFPEFEQQFVYRVSKMCTVGLSLEVLHKFALELMKQFPDAKRPKAASSRWVRDVLERNNMTRSTNPSLKIIHPIVGNDNHDDMVNVILPELEKEVCQPATIANLWTRIAHNDKSLMGILGQRIELFVARVRKLPTTAFDLIAKRICRLPELSVEGLRTKLIDYIESQTKLDERLAHHVISYIAIILSVGKNQEVLKEAAKLVSTQVLNKFELGDGDAKQYMHLDSVNPNCQIVVAISDEIPPTRIYTGTLSCSNWGLLFLARKWNEYPPTLHYKLDKHPSDMLLTHGSLLDPKLTLVPSSGLLRRGDTTTMPGVVVHAGPSCDKVHCILFSTGAPHDTKGAYDPESQYCASQVFAELTEEVLLLYNADTKQFLLDHAERVFFLNKLVEFEKEGRLKGTGKTWYWLDHKLFIYGFLEHLSVILVDDTTDGDTGPLVDFWACKMPPLQSQVPC